jgi:dihydrofolate reductase
MRARCSVFIATTLDGFIARPGGAMDWLSLVERPGEDYGYRAYFASVDTLVIGRKTYEAALGFDTWPYEGKRTVVMTTTQPLQKHGESTYDGPPEALVDRLTTEGARHVYVDGGAVIRLFVAAGLISDLTISVVPVLLGEGIPLWGKLGRDVRLDLVESRAFPSGLVQLAYRVG